MSAFRKRRSRLPTFRANGYFVPGVGRAPLSVVEEMEMHRRPKRRLRRSGALSRCFAAAGPYLRRPGPAGSADCVIEGKKRKR
ncbi:protein of unknown function [Methylacidimicrobium sp. AP8]|nr:protein of unknown function [Methylacidimicrobium sp. AP8]